MLRYRAEDTPAALPTSLPLHAGFFAAIGFFLLTMSNAVLACQIPVFRYALERWQPDPYEVVVIHRGSLSPEHARFVQQ